MTKNPFFILVILLAAYLSGCGGDNGGKTSTTDNITERPVTEQVPASRHITSAITGIEYPVHVYLPPGYSSSDKSYPVIYGTDGQWSFQTFSDLLAKHAKEIVLVSVEQGPNNRRAIDYRLPGARKYYQFLITELLPDIENTYRIDTSDRTLVGTSYGGVLVGAVLLLDDPVTPHFKNYLSFDGSFYEHPTLTAELEQERFNASQEMNATVMFTSALVIGNDRYVTVLENHLRSREYYGLTIIRRAYPVEHDDVAAPSFEEAIELIF